MREEPIKEDDDAMDAARYAIHSSVTRNPVVKTVRGFW
jgi:hypothetical protein